MVCLPSGSVRLKPHIKPQKEPFHRRLDGSVQSSASSLNKQRRAEGALFACISTLYMLYLCHGALPLLSVHNELWRNDRVLWRSLPRHRSGPSIELLQIPFNFFSAAAKAGPCNIKLTGGDAEGPYYKPYAPFQPQAPEVPSICKSSLVNERVFISGNVSKLLQSGPSGDVCQLVGTKVLLDLWAADPNGEYSNISPLSPDYVSQITCKNNKPWRTMILIDLKQRTAWSCGEPVMWWESPKPRYSTQQNRSLFGWSKGSLKCPDWDWFYRQFLYSLWGHAQCL